MLSQGHLTASVLNVLRSSEITYLNLSSSISDEDGLNLAGGDIFPGWFQDLPSESA